MSQHNLHTRVANAIRERNLAAPHDCLIVAVSGGADSVALLDLLATLPWYSFRLIVAHLNHLLRGPESDGDELFVAQLAAHYNLPCAIKRVDVRSLASRQRQSLEEAGREARYAFFEELRQRHQAAAIALAHHADDQAETLLMRLLRGAGTSGLAAMAHRSDQAVIRPLLGLHRDELRTHLAHHGIPFREDASNQDRTFLRNRIRHELLPLLASYNPAISDRLAATADLLAEDELLLEQLTRQAWQQLAQQGEGWASLGRSLLAEQPSAMRMRLYRLAIVEASGDLRRIERKHCLAVDQLLQTGKTGGRVALPKGLTALLTSDRLLIARRELVRPRPSATISINGPGCYELGNGLQLLVEQAAAPDDWQTLPPYVSYVDPTQAPFPWQLRPAKADDRLELLGLNGSRLVRDILVDAKLPRHLRPSLPLLLCDGKPLWLAPLRRTRLALMSPGQSGGMRLTLLGRERLPLFP
jgi:tRNA(Ile)-lysidine synthase